jgi:hypothetical protein
LLSGRKSLTALGLISVEVSMKKMRSRNTKSDIDDEPLSICILF